MIPDKFKTLDTGEKFLQFDSGVEDPLRVLIFASSSGIEDLRRYRNWTTDGTFKATPRSFYQLYTIHIQLGGSSIPRIFALLPNKAEEVYTKVFLKVKELVLETPLTVMSDFEKAAINSIQTVFPRATQTGCFFHFCQSLYRKVVDLGLREKYHNDHNFNIAIRSISALAFLPADDVESGYEDILEAWDIPEEFLNYFELTYMGIVRGRGRNRRQGAPPFSIALWNVYDRVQNDINRTNNSVEAFNNAFTKSNNLNHPDIWKLIHCLKKEECLSQTKRGQIESGEVVKTARRYKIINKNIARIVGSYDDDDKITYL